MTILNKIRFPFPEDKLFSVIFLLVVFVPLAFAPGLTDPYEGLKFSLYSVFLGVAFILLIIKNKTVQINYKLTFALLAFLLWSIISTFFSLDPLTSLIETNLRFTSSVYFYGLWIFSIFVFWQSLSDEKTTFLLKSLVAASVAIAALEILQSFGIAHYEGINAGIRPIIPSFLGNPNFSSMFIVTLLPVAVIFGFQSRFKLSRFYYIIATIFIIWGVGLSSSRGSMLALAVELVLLAVLAIFQSRKLLIPVLAASLAAGLLFFGFYSTYRPDSTGQTFALSERTISSRFVAWDNMITIISNYPVSGTGPGNLIMAYHLVSPSAFAAEQVFDDAHNIFLHLAAVGGLPLFILFLGILILTFYNGYVSYIKKKNLLMSAVMIGLLGLIVSMNFNPVVVGCWLLLATFIAIVNFDSLDKKFGMNKTFKVLFMVYAIFLLLVGVMTLANSIVSRAAIKAYRMGDIEKSYKYANIALNFNPLKVDTYLYKIASAIKLGKDRDSIDQEIHRYSLIQPENSETFLNISTLQVIRYQQTQDKKYLSSSYAYLDLAKKHAPNFLPFVTKDAYLRFVTGDLVGSKNILSQALVIDDKNYYNWILRAKIFQVLNDKKQMVFSLQKAQEISPAVFTKYTINQANLMTDVSKIDLSIYFPQIDIGQ